MFQKTWWEWHVNACHPATSPKSDIFWGLPNSLQRMAVGTTNKCFIQYEVGGHPIHVQSHTWCFNNRCKFCRVYVSHLRLACPGGKKVSSPSKLMTWHNLYFGLAIFWNTPISKGTEISSPRVSRTRLLGDFGTKFHTLYYPGVEFKSDIQITMVSFLLLPAIHNGYGRDLDVNKTATLTNINKTQH